MAIHSAMAVVRGMFPRNYSAARAQIRHECRLDAELILLDSDISLKGKILDISTRGALFRPPQIYLLSRSGTLVRLAVGDVIAEGAIVNTTARGYGIQFKSELPIGAVPS